MRGYKSAGVLLSLAATALAEPFPSAVDMESHISALKARGQDGTMMGAMAGLQKRESILSLMKRGFSEMDGVYIPVVVPRQVDTIPTDPKTGNTGKSNFDVALWDQQVEAACAESIGLLTDIVTKITDPAGVAVCYNIPFYNSTSGAFASDIRLYKIANGTKDWEAAGTKVSLSVQYEGATVRLANAPAAAAGSNKVATAKEVQAGQSKIKDTGDESVQQAAKALEKPTTTAKTSAPATSAAAKSSAPASSAAAAAKAGQTPSTATLKKRMNMNMAQMGGSDEVSVKGFEPKLLQTMRFVGQVNPNIMGNQTIAKDPSIMKLVLTPSLMLIGVTPEGNMNASVAAAQVQYATGAFSSITTPTPEPAPFVLPGVFISIFPLGLYLCIVYTILFVLIVGWGTVERYLFRMSFRKRSAMMNGQDGFGKI
ncbi:hypothetical protein TWF106_000772 [Orbilia oligospora]|uniref:Uncharacterized protein n=1 Tax=Orbilia oligospora TaxID=2813651 RepID=A0A6G1M9E3_ORBOL|nr:hypothetical protein TWF788_005921 [Orbilia oligospora]KAF3222978.1 hypothetical protein TWF679_004175 [Orbilia oligospora]KAF3226278.1 hypothetical protein TWF106_000772 [Orbilia oligospora]KAF3226696.1 hypothetical protein TWF191_004520 [Orbilia oligospora]KAF3250733.1 hypothetical protein TWF192_005173 [Orbilia oligospora]